MKSQPNSMSFRYIPWLKLACMASLVGFVSVACGSQPTPSPTPPANSLAETPTTSAPQTSLASPSEPTPEPTASETIPAVSLATPQECKIVMARISDPDPPTNVRSSPEVKPDNIVGQIENGRLVSVSEEQNGWFRISEPAGWVSKNVTQSTCSEKTETITFEAGGNSATIAGEFIGTGSHDYILQAQQGQTITLTALDGPLPFLYSANDPNRQNDLTNYAGQSNQTTWSGQLPATGQYILALDSNFRGYTYKFSVQIQ
jgi:hypothetical protein